MSPPDGSPEMSTGAAPDGAHDAEPPDAVSSAALADARAEALRRDADDPLAGFREHFRIPSGPDGTPSAYFCGNSLGLQPTAAHADVLAELEDWAQLGVRGHLEGRTPWYSYHERFRESGARVVGAEPGEVVMMNGLTVNLHLMMVSFYRPSGARTKILIEAPAFPSDRYAVETQIRLHGLDPKRELIEVSAPAGEYTVNEDDVVAEIERAGSELALVLVGGVNFLTGQRFDLERIAEAARAQGAVVGFDLAHAAGNVPLQLHDWNADFAVWCNYKYLNAGPGAVAGCFVHARHHGEPFPGLAGWWGNDPATRFRMQLIPDFVPHGGAEAWQLSNPPILAMAPLKASMDLFDRAGIQALRTKSLELTGFLERLLDRHCGHELTIMTPRDPERRGCQLSLLVPDGARTQARLESAGVVTDFREPDVIRAAPTPLYNTFYDAWRLVAALTGSGFAPQDSPRGTAG